MKNHLRILIAIVLVFASLVTVFPSNALAECDHSNDTYVYTTDKKHWEFCLDCGETLLEDEHYSLCCGDGNCDVCGESYSPLNIVHHYEESATVCCCGEEQIGVTNTPSNGNNNNISNYLGTWKAEYMMYDNIVFPAVGELETDNIVVNLKVVDNEYIDCTLDGEIARMEWELVDGKLVLKQSGVSFTLEVDYRGYLFLYTDSECLVLAKEDESDGIKARKETNISDFHGNWKLDYVFFVDDIQGTTESLGMYDVILNLKAVNDTYMNLTFDGETERVEWEFVDGVLMALKGGALESGGTIVCMEIDYRDHLFYYNENGYMEFVRED